MRRFSSRERRTWDASFSFKMMLLLRDDCQQVTTTLLRRLPNQRRQLDNKTVSLSRLLESRVSSYFVRFSPAATRHPCRIRRRLLSSLQAASASRARDNRNWVDRWHFRRQDGRHRRANDKERRIFLDRSLLALRVYRFSLRFTCERVPAQGRGYLR